MPAHKWLLRILALAGLALILLWPAMVNGGPFFFPDTRTYLRVADAAVNKLTHKTTIWTVAAGDSTEGVSIAAAGQTASRTNQDGAVSHLAPEISATTSSPASERNLSTIKQRGFMLGRSLYYGLILYFGALSQTFWPTLLLQATALLLAIYLLLKSFDYPIWPHLGIITVALAVLSNAPFFVSFLMPDLFAGIVILLCAVLISIRRSVDILAYLPFYLLLSAGMLFHDSCGLISVCLIGGAVIVNLLLRSWTNWRGLCVVLLAVITGLAGQRLFAAGVKRATGQAPMRYPFLSARLVADGPGTQYLRSHCPADGLVLCRYVKDFPMTSEEFLFGTVPGKTLFATASYSDRLAVSKEQFSFLLAVFKSEPMEVLRTSFRNAVGELFDFTLDDFSYDQGEKHNFDRSMPVETLARLHRSAAYRNALPIKGLNRMVYAVVLVSTSYLLLAMFGTLPGRRMSPTQRHLFYWTAFGLVVNAVVCGALSGVFPRYEARVIWLLPLLAIFVETQVWTSRPRGSDRRNRGTVQVHVTS